jgi:periplasmic protein TonB
MKNFKNDSSNFNELLFEKRNKEYGAYVIRKEYEENLIKSFFGAIFSILLFVGIYAVLNKSNAETMLPPAKKIFEQLTIEVDLSHLNQVKKIEPILQKPVEINKASSSKSEVAVVVKDELVLEEKKKVEETTNTTSTSNNKTDNLNIVTGNQLGKEKVESNLGLVTNEAVKNLAELEVAPEFPGGMDKLMEFLAKNVKYPMSAKENGIKGTVYVSFMVDKSGKVKEVKLKRGIFSACDEEVIRVVNLFPPWKPGVYQGQNVNVLFNLPVTFDLRN